MSLNFARKLFIALSKILLVWILLQFFLHTLFTFKFNLVWGFRNILRLRKEIIIFVLWLLWVVFLIKERKVKTFFRQKFFRNYSILLLICIFVIFIVSFLINKNSVEIILASVKYSLSGFMIFLIFAINSWLFLNKEDKIFEIFFDKTIKRLLAISLLWRFVAWFAPKTFTFVGYDEFAYEWEVGKAPPAKYSSQYNTGLVRNQSVFERPISLWFFLVALWPFFFLRRKNLHETIIWSWIFWLNIFLTFSRAAWIAWILLSWILIFLKYKRSFFKLFSFTFLPILIVFTLTIYFHKDKVLTREYSDKWHFENIIIAIKHIKEKPLWWLWAGQAGPVTHQYDEIKNYNPENQFLQIWLEYWIFGFLARVSIWILLLSIGIKTLRNFKFNGWSKTYKNSLYLVFAFSLGLLGLSIEGMVLHSFVDRMVVYPFMALFWIFYVIHIKKLTHNPK